MPLPLRPPRSVQPAAVSHGVALFHCPALSARISVRACEENQEIARSSPRKKMGAQYITGSQRRNGVSLKRGLTPEGDQWQEALIRDRKDSCLGCPGVIELARMARDGG